MTDGQETWLATLVALMIGGLLLIAAIAGMKNCSSEAAARELCIKEHGVWVGSSNACILEKR